MAIRPPRSPLRFHPVPGAVSRSPRLVSEVQSPAVQVIEFLRAAREGIAQIKDITDLNCVLGAIRDVEAEAETARLLVILSDRDARDSTDEIVNTAGAARLLGRSPDWVAHNKAHLTGAVVSPIGTRPRYSKNKLIELRERWNRSARTHS